MTNWPLTYISKDRKNRDPTSWSGLAWFGQNRSCFFSLFLPISYHLSLFYFLFLLFLRLLAHCSFFCIFTQSLWTATLHQKLYAPHIKSLATHFCLGDHCSTLQLLRSVWRVFVRQLPPRPLLSLSCRVTKVVLSARVTCNIVSYFWFTWCWLLIFMFVFLLFYYFYLYPEPLPLNSLL